MKNLKTKIAGIILLFIAIGLANCRQEKMFFHPTSLTADYEFKFSNNFIEYKIPVEDKITLNGLLFKAEQPKGLVFYLHGNAGALDTWGEIADFYTQNNYDVFILDYRGFGKSEGRIENEGQFLNDVQLVYDSLKTDYLEENIIVIGYSIGTCPAAYVAAKNNPKHLVLKAPYYSMLDLVHHYYSFVPGFMVKYKLRTNEYVKEVKAPITIFHGTDDKIIPVENAYKLQAILKPANDTLIIVEGKTHHGVGNWNEYKSELTNILK
ncbi:lysophospholipase [Vicingus serpentipes]|uniref:Lysophospholipase n=1 Tax=Vicingus serpentipes TaxID=1926625 RepID=A0A5C6RZ65_9FLAO|nr:alpha/beta fold hydrolase [Vicingus serpentipes]TXB66662.1 lysophospholipase [Vicingus serpentipes]